MVWNPADLAAGNAKELAVIPYIVGYYKALGKKKVEVKLNDAESLAGKRVCDLHDNFGVKWEVKYDRRHKDTGNVYLEHAALRHSGADFYVFYLDEHPPVMISKDLLMVLVEDNLELEEGLRKYQVVNRPNEATLIPLPDLLKIGKILINNHGEIKKDKKRQPAIAKEAIPAMV